MQPELDERFAVDVLCKHARAELVAYGVRQRRAAARRGLAIFATHDLGTARVEVELQRLALVFAERLVIKLAQDVAWNIANHQPHDLLVDAAFEIVERPANRLVEGSG